MFAMRRLTVSAAVECCLLFLALSVVSWGLQGKLSLYHGEQGKIFTTNSMAKLSTETRSARSVSSFENQQKPRFTNESPDLATVFLAQGSRTHPAMPSLPGAPQPIPARPLPSPNLLRRPPPILS